MQLSDLAHIVHGQLQGQNKEWLGVSTDTRQLQPGQLFIALKGEHFDAHDFIELAEQKGAAAAIVHRPVTSKIPLIYVPDTLQALADLAFDHQSKFSCPRIAVTGSCGKTTSKMLLANVFATVGNVLSNPASFNNAIGVPLTLLQLTADYQYAITEIGANHLKEIGVLARLVKPKVAIITNAANVHLEGFGDIDGVAKTKGEIFEGLTADGVAVINADDAKADYWRQLASAYRIITFGINQLADIYAENITLDARGNPHFTLFTPEGCCNIQLPIMGTHNVYNALIAAAAAYIFNIKLDNIRQGLENATAVSKRLVEYKGQADAIVIDDSYNANPASMLAAIQLLTQRSRQTILVMGDMLELGPRTDEFHHQVGIQAKQHGVKQLFCLGKYSESAARAFGDCGFSFENRDQLIDALKPQLNKEVTVLVKGSRGMAMEKIVAAIKK